MTNAHDFPPPLAYDIPVLGPREERARAFPTRARRVTFWSAIGGAGATAAIGALKHARGVAGGAAVVAAGLGIARSQLSRFFTEEADYVVERTVGDLEVRRYAKHAVAETDVDADGFHDALDEAFPRLAAYLRESKLAMTVPVLVARSDRRDWTTMRLRPNADFVRSGPGRFTIRFVLPDVDAPQATDARVHIREIPEHRVAALRFRGRLVDRNIEAAEAELDHAMTHALLTGRGEHIVAGYDAPWTLPALRRSEIWLTLA